MKAVRYFLIFIAAALAAVLIADMTFLGTATAFIRNGRMAYGLKAGSVSIGGMTREEAAREIQRIAKTALNGEALILSLPDENHAFSFSAEEIGLSVDTDKMLDAAFSVGRDGSTAQQVFSMLECAFQGKETPLFAALDNAKLDQALQRVKQAVDRAHRIGQTRTVFVHTFICAGTLEDHIDEMLEAKRRLADEVVTGGESFLLKMNPREFERVTALDARDEAD